MFSRGNHLNLSPHFLWRRVLRNCYSPATISYTFVGQTVRVSVFSSPAEELVPARQGSWLVLWSHVVDTLCGEEEEEGLATR